MMGGTLALSSQPNVGTQVHITLKLPSLTPCLEQAEKEPEVAQSTRPLNVLVVDDHPANRLLMCQQLGFLGHMFTTAQHGAAGLELWKQGAFDVVIADCNMPVMDGYQATREIRDFDLETPVVALSANVFSDEIQNAFESGMDDFLEKPIVIPKLLATLRQFIAASTNT